MNKLIKQIFNKICIFLTWIINQGQILMCRRESHTMWHLPQGGISEEIKEKFKSHKEYLKQYGFRPVKRDFFVFAPYLLDKNRDPKYIVPSYITHQYLTSIFNPIQYTAYFEDKNLLDRILPKEYVPKTYFRRIGGQWYDGDYNPIEFKDIENILKSGDLPSMIVKPARDSSSGKGIMLFKNDGGKWNSLKNDGDFFTMLKDNAWGGQDLIIQEIIRQHEFYSHLCDTAVNSLRVIVYNSPVDNKLSLIWCGLKIGAKGSVVDNNHAGGIIFGIDTKGKINNYGTDQYGTKFHHFNGIDFSKEEFYIPNFNEITSFAKSISGNFLPNRILSFDIAMDKDQRPIVIECNLRGYSGWLCQFAGDYMFAEKTDEILSYLSRHKKEGIKFFYKIN